jgi:hypothetical protein
MAHVAALSSVLRVVGVGGVLRVVELGHTGTIYPLGVYSQAVARHACCLHTRGRDDQSLTGMPTVAPLAMLVDHIGGFVNHHRRERKPG